MDKNVIPKRDIMDDVLKMGVNTEYVSTLQKLQPLLRGTITGGSVNSPAVTYVISQEPNH